MFLRSFTRAATACRPALTAAALLAAAGGAAPALAQDCRLSVTPVDPILMPGESTPVHVWAHFPPTAYAFASSEFVVRAGMPAWTSASAGAIAGADVLGIVANQAHSPPMGILADPANPLRIWAGVFTPDSYDPALVRVRATPSSFAFYPSDLTSSSAPCDADPGRAWIMVNPLAAGRSRVAPGEGTGIEVIGDDLVIGTNPDEAVLIGLLLPAVQKVREAAAVPPDSLTIEMSLEPTAAGGDPLPAEEMSLNYTKVEFDYNVEVRWPLATQVCTEIVLQSGQTVALPCSGYGPQPFSLPRLPDSRTMWVEIDEANERTTVVVEMGFDEPIEFLVPGTPPQTTRTVRMQCQNNLKQLGLAAHSYHALGTPSFSLTIESTCAADANGDGAVNSNDISAFLTSWLASIQGGTLDADFNVDQQVNSNDISAFLSAWLDAVQNGC